MKILDQTLIQPSFGAQSATNYPHNCLIGSPVSSSALLLLRKKDISHKFHTFEIVDIWQVKPEPVVDIFPHNIVDIESSGKIFKPVFLGFAQEPTPRLPRSVADSWTGTQEKLIIAWQNKLNSA